MRSPDAAWVRLSRWKALSDAERRRFAPICPDFVIELRSPSDGLVDLRAKMEHWIANGAELGWLIDPVEKTVEVYRAGQAAEVYVEPSSVQATGVVAGFELVMARIWE